MEISAREQLRFSIQGVEHIVQQLKSEPNINQDLARSEERELEILKHKLDLLPE